jgi:crotonobetainyl-CoA:carnitine CoA-transferase CaiB-like acyl-CoA transferase
LREIDHPELGRLTIYTSPIRLNRKPNVPRSLAPTLGKDNEGFYAKEFGLTSADLAEMRARKII